MMSGLYLARSPGGLGCALRRGGGRLAWAAMVVIAFMWVVCPPASARAPGVTLSGEPLVHTFSLTPGESVEGAWTLTHHGQGQVRYDGSLTPVGAVSSVLADVLGVQYGQVRGGEVVWYDAGTLSAPVSLAAAFGGVDLSISGGQSLTIPVRVVLHDAIAMAGAPGAVLRVDADFGVSYISDEQAQVPDQHGTSPILGAMPRTGPGGIVWIAVLAALALASGTGCVRWRAALSGRRR